jgi:tetrahydromethanopterin S-methyltransferase subunit B
MSEGQAVEVDVKALVERIEKLEARCDDFLDAFMDQHEDMRNFAELLNKYAGSVQAEGSVVAKQCFDIITNQCQQIMDRTSQNIDAFTAATKAALSPESLAKATAAVTPERIAEY